MAVGAIVKSVKKGMTMLNAARQGTKESVPILGRAMA
jgi:hypothetical protein